MISKVLIFITTSHLVKNAFSQLKTPMSEVASLGMSEVKVMAPLSYFSLVAQSNNILQAFGGQMRRLQKAKRFVVSFHHDVCGIHANTSQVTPKRKQEDERGGERKEQREGKKREKRTPYIFRGIPVCTHILCVCFSVCSLFPFLCVTLSLCLSTRRISDRTALPL
jgi:hypothetical protein